MSFAYAMDDGERVFSFCQVLTETFVFRILGGKKEEGERKGGRNGGRDR